jgi:hypothetical protein
MKRNLAFAVALVLAVGLAVSFHRGQSEARAEKQAKAQQWEYKVFPFATFEGKVANNFTEKMNKLAAEGWEHVGTVSTSSKTYGNGSTHSTAYIAFKRPKK